MRATRMLGRSSRQIGRVAGWILIAGVLALLGSPMAVAASVAAQPEAESQATPQAAPQIEPPREGPVPLDEALPEDLRAGLGEAAIRLPLAALLGAVLALRPRRGPSTPRDPAVVETQIVLAVVGALIMLIVGASLARAFGIAGAANLIRYRAKIDDPKDAVVMLSALSVGLASGVGLFGIAVAATIFLAVTLWTIEGFQHRMRTFLLTVGLGDKTPSQQPQVERILKSARIRFELRSTSDTELSYLVTARESLRTERLSAALKALSPDGSAQIEWKDDGKIRPVPEKEAKKAS